MEPATTAGIDPAWEADHPYLLGGTFAPDGTYTAPTQSSFFWDTGMVVPELDPPGFNASRCSDEECTPHTVGPDGRTVRDSHLVLFRTKPLEPGPASARRCYPPRRAVSGRALDPD